MNKFSFDSNYKKNTLSKKISREKITNTKSTKTIIQHIATKELTSKPKRDTVQNMRTYHLEAERKIHRKEDVAFSLSKKIKLGDVRRIKLEYFVAYQQMMDQLDNANKVKKVNFRKRLVKVAISLVLFVAVVTMLVLSQTKEVKLIVNGVEKTTRTNQFLSSVYAKKIAENEKFDDYKYTCSTDDVIKEDSIIEISNLKTVTTNIKGDEVTHETYADTLSEFLNEQEDVLTKYKGKYTFFIKEYQKDQEKIYLKDISNLNIYLMSKKSVEKTITTKYKTKYVDNKKLESGTLKVKQKGKTGKYVKKYETIYLNDKKYKTTETISKVIQKKQDKIIERGTKVVSASDSVWDRLAQCETGGRWHLNSGNGFYGGLQFSAPTWNTASAKVGVSAPYAHMASKEDQIKAAVWLQKNSGWGQWPHCSSKLGLR